MSSLLSSRLLSRTLTPFLYPCLDSAWVASAYHTAQNVISRRQPRRRPHISKRHQTTTSTSSEPSYPPIDIYKYDHLTLEPLDYTATPFTDSTTLTLTAGGGGNGCISFLREKYIPNGPADGGDGGTGGNVYIQAVRGETSLHKLARRSILKAGRGRNGEGGGRGGKRGEDLVVQVPVGTVVREVGRVDALAEEEEREGGGVRRRGKGFGRDLEDEKNGVVADEGAVDQTRKWRRDKWLLYPGALPKSFTTADFPALPRPRRSNLVASQPPAPLRLDLDRPMSTPMLLVAGAMGGLGNPHFVTKSIPRPKFATKGDDGVKVQLHLELKILADVGLVGLPNAGKSTLLRALTRSRTKVGNWAFTTLSPNIGTVVLDDYSGRPSLSPSSISTGGGKEARTHFTIADIPGLIEDAHLDRGLGLGFLRHIERAAVLAFVIDLSAGDAVQALKALWKEVGEYEKLREREVKSETQRPAAQDDGVVAFQPFESSISPGFDPEPRSTTPPTQSLTSANPHRWLEPLGLPSISAKPWFVVATKADLPDTQENFAALQAYLSAVQAGHEPHPSGKQNAWKRKLYAVPVSAMRKEGVEGINGIVLDLLDG